jgi:hypothetical protein
MTSQPPKPRRGLDWTQSLREAGIPEPPWDKPIAIKEPAQEVQAPDPEDSENWMHK